MLQEVGILSLLLSPLVAPAEPSRARAVEIRSYNLVPGSRERFHRRFLEEALPLLEQASIDVVAFGPSLHDKDSYYLVRSYAGLEERQQSEDAFYGSSAWKEGPREAILADIVSYTTIVVVLDEATIEGFRKTKEGSMTSDRESLLELNELIDLNQEYIRSVQSSDVGRFEEILAEDFLCSLPDGSLLDRRQFLEQTAAPVSITDLEAHDVNVRLMGDFAIVHARTTYRNPDGTEGKGRYTDVWAKRNGRWLAVSAHVTRN